jgi:hypothetical protein
MIDLFNQRRQELREELARLDAQASAIGPSEVMVERRVAGMDTALKELEEVFCEIQSVLRVQIAREPLTPKNYADLAVPDMLDVQIARLGEYVSMAREIRMIITSMRERMSS